MKHQTPKTKELQNAVIAKVKQRLDAAKSGHKVDLVKLKKQLIASITANNEKKTIKLLGDIQKNVSNKDLVTVMKEVKAAVEANKFTFPKYIEIIQTARPKWYKDPAEEVKITGPIEVKNAVKIEGTVKTEADAGTWTALAAVLGVVMEGLFSYLNKFSQKVFRVMPSKEHYTTPQLVVLADPKTGRPVSLKDIGQGNGQTIVQVTGGKSSSGSSTGGVDPVGLKNTSGTPVNPATQDTLALVLAQLEQIEANTDNLEITAETINLNTDQLEAKIDETNARIGEVGVTPTANTVQDRLKSIKTVLDSILAANDSLEANTTGLATQATLASVLTAVDGIETLLTTLNGQTDNVESTLTTIAGYLDTVETKLQSLIDAGPSQILKATIDLTASGDVLAPTSGQRLRVYAIKFSLSADMSSASFNFGANAAFEKYLNPKGGGLYGSNVAPNYIQGGVDEKLKLILSGTGTVTINIDYKIVS